MNCFNIEDILKNDYTILRTMIICINAEEAEKLNEFLHLTKKTLLIHEKMKLFDIQGREITLSYVLLYHYIY